jgi:hypothetical protein
MHDADVIDPRGAAIGEDFRPGRLHKLNQTPPCTPLSRAVNIRFVHAAGEGASAPLIDPGDEVHEERNPNLGVVGVISIEQFLERCKQSCG